MSSRSSIYNASRRSTASSRISLYTHSLSARPGFRRRTFFQLWLHRGRRGVDDTGVIVAHALTEATVDDATTGVELIEAIHDDITRVTADAAYDTVTFYDAAGARGRACRGSAGQDGQGVPTQAAVERS